MIGSKYHWRKADEHRQRALDLGFDTPEGNLARAKALDHEWAARRWMATEDRWSAGIFRPGEMLVASGFAGVMGALIGWLTW